MFTFSITEENQLNQKTIMKKILMFTFIIPLRKVCVQHATINASFIHHMQQIEMQNKADHNFACNVAWYCLGRPKQRLWLCLMSNLWELTALDNHNLFPIITKYLMSMLVCENFLFVSTLFFSAEVICFLWICKTSALLSPVEK